MSGKYTNKGSKVRRRPSGKSVKPDRPRRGPINPTVFTQVGLDSGALGRLGAVVHQFKEPGHYQGFAVTDGDPHGRFTIVVSEGGSPQAEVDLASLADETVDGREIQLGVGGRVSFFVGSGARRWSTQVVDAETGAPEFDSTRLTEGDIFAASILRPGTYRVRNEYGRGQTALTVRYVRRGREALRQGDPLRLRMGAKASRAAANLSPVQGIVFEVLEPARIVVDLTEPNDGRGKGRTGGTGRKKGAS